MAPEEKLRHDFRDLRVQWEELERTAERNGVPMDDLPDYPDHAKRLLEFAFRDDLPPEMREWADGEMEKATSLGMARGEKLGNDFRDLRVQWEELERTAERNGVPMDDLPDYPDHAKRLLEFAFRDDLPPEMREWADGEMEKATSLGMARGEKLGNDFRDLRVQWEELERTAERNGVPMDDLPDYPDHAKRLLEFAFRDDLPPEMREWADGEMEKATSLGIAKTEAGRTVAPEPAGADAGRVREPKVVRPASNLGRPPAPAADVPDEVATPRKTQERKAAGPAEEEHKPTVRHRTRRRGRSM